MNTLWFHKKHWLTMVLGLSLGLSFTTLLPIVYSQEKSQEKTSPPSKTQLQDASSTTPAPPKPEVKNTGPLQTLAEQLSARPALASGRFGLRVASLTTGQTLADVEGSKVFLPASNMKLYTTATALDKLGPDFRIRTSVYAVPPDATGTVRGDLVLYGRGDPNLSDRFNEKKADPTLTPLEKLADQLSAAGIKHITGDLVGDESYFRGAPLGNGWEWNDLQWYYGAEISALSAADNQIRLSVVPGKIAGEPCTVTVFPPTSIVTIVNRTTTYTGQGERKLGIHRGLADNVFDVWGSFPVGDEGASAPLAIHDPALFTVSLFKQILAKRGIIVDGVLRRADANLRVQQPLDLTRLKEVAFIESPPLSEMIHVINKQSQNLHAELLLRQAGKLYGSKDLDSDEAGVALMQDLLKRAGADTTALRLRDGSGLSRLDFVSPESTVKLLTFMYHHPYATTYLDSLPIAGVDGTLRGRMGKTKAEKNLRAKTGTLDDVSSLSGFVTAANGDVLVFSLMMNNLTADRSQGVAAGNILGEALANYGTSDKVAQTKP